MNTIKANELRIGNVVFYQGTTSCNVEITGQDIADLFSGKFNEIGVELKPIPLTEEIIIRMGFNSPYKNDEAETVDYWGKDLDASISVETADSGFTTEKLFRYNVSQTRQKPIIYVHQLQNLHFALKGTELPCVGF